MGLQRFCRMSKHIVPSAKTVDWRGTDDIITIYSKMKATTCLMSIFLTFRWNIFDTIRSVVHSIRTFVGVFFSELYSNFKRT